VLHISFHGIDSIDLDYKISNISPYFIFSPSKIVPIYCRSVHNNRKMREPYDFSCKKYFWKMSEMDLPVISAQK